MLLDTHVWLWIEFGDPRIPQFIINSITKDPTSIHLSAISVWEALMLFEKKRIKLASSTSGLNFVKDLVEKCPFKIIPITHQIAILSRELLFQHEDPADRFIAATSVAYNQSLVTADTRLTSLSFIDSISI